MAQEQGENLQKLIGKEVKVIYNDLGKPHFARGILKSETKAHIFVEGDISSQLIAKQTILKLNCIKNRGEVAEDESI